MAACNISCLDIYILSTPSLFAAVPSKSLSHASFERRLILDRLVFSDLQYFIDPVGNRVPPYSGVHLPPKPDLRSR